MKIKSPHLNDTAKRTVVAELIIHKRRINKFYSALKNEVTDSKNKVNENVLAIIFLLSFQYFASQITSSGIVLHETINCQCIFYS